MIGLQVKKTVHIYHLTKYSEGAHTSPLCFETHDSQFMIKIFALHVTNEMEWLAILFMPKSMVYPSFLLH